MDNKNLTFFIFCKILKQEKQQIILKTSIRYNFSLNDKLQIEKIYCYL